MSETLSRAVMQRRSLPAKGLDFFPTPPWATRAFLADVIAKSGRPIADFMSVWEPAAGKGHMFYVLQEAFQFAHASDVHDYGTGFGIASYVGSGPDVLEPLSIDWIITNPPFNLALEFAERAIGEARAGVALLLRSSWAEGGGRYERLFKDRPPSLIAQYCDRVPMVAGRWDPQASSATSYAWFVWFTGDDSKRTSFVWIPPGAKARHSRPEDLERWSA